MLLPLLLPLCVAQLPILQKDLFFPSFYTYQGTSFTSLPLFFCI